MKSILTEALLADDFDLATRLASSNLGRMSVYKKWYSNSHPSLHFQAATVQEPSSPRQISENPLSSIAAQPKRDPQFETVHSRLEKIEIYSVLLHLPSNWLMMTLLFVP